MMNRSLPRALTLSATLALLPLVGCTSNSGSTASDDQTIHDHKSEDHLSRDDKAMMKDDKMSKDEKMMSEDKMAKDKKMMSDDKMAKDRMKDDKGMAVAMPEPMNDGMTAKQLMMKADGDIIETATGPGMSQVTTLVTAIKAADLVKPLKGEGPFTVFAPTNAAFDKLPAGTLEELLKPENKEQLQAILLGHVHSGDAVLAKDVKTMSLSTLEGSDLKVKVDGKTVTVNDAKVIKTDVIASNGIIHWIDTVILP